MFKLKKVLSGSIIPSFGHIFSAAPVSTAWYSSLSKIQNTALRFENPSEKYCWHTESYSDTYILNISG